MALDDTAVIIPGTGYVFTNPTIAQAPPATTTAAIAALDLTAATLSTGWANMGHTAREDNVSIGKDGGDTNVVGSWQTSSLRTTVDPIVYTIGINALQISNEVAQLYFGGGSIAGTDVYDLPDTPVAQDRALWICMVDGSIRLPIYVPKVSIIGSDAIEVDTGDFLQFNLTATFLKSGANPLARLFHPALGA